MNGAVPPMRDRFRGFLPVVVDVETGGFNAATDALLEIAAVLVVIDAEGRLVRGPTYREHVRPFEGGRLDPASLAVNGIDPYHPLRIASTESDALGTIFGEVRRAVREQQCTRAILVGHNASFDLGFVNAAVARAGIRRNPFHPFSCFDTATLAGVAYGQTVLSRAIQAAGLEWNSGEAHSAAYDAERTADLFCVVCNQFQADLRGGCRAARRRRAPRSRRIRCSSRRRSSATVRVQASRARLLQQRLEFAGAIHLGHDVAAADELALDVELRVGGPVRVRLERLAQLRLLEDVDVAVARLERAQGARGLRRESALREVRRALHEQHDRRGIELLPDASGSSFRRSSNFTLLFIRNATRICPRDRLPALGGSHPRPCGDFIQCPEAAAADAPIVQRADVKTRGTGAAFVHGGIALTR